MADKQPWSWGVPALTKVDWQRHGLEPRWLEMETADCAAVVQPDVNRFAPSAELGRFLAGAARRGEVALVVAMLAEARKPYHGGAYAESKSETVYLPGSRYVIHGRLLPTGTRAGLADEVSPAERDLGLRLLNRTPDAPCWSLTLSGLTGLPGHGGDATTFTPEGELRPILVDPLGEPVAAVWLSPDHKQRWYIIPCTDDWHGVLDWLVHQAMPTYLPSVLRRSRTVLLNGDSELQTRDEAVAQEALTDMEARHVEERSRLEADLKHAHHQAEPVRYDLLYGTSDALVHAVDTVLTAAGFTITNLDAEFGTRSADLLATLGRHRRLIEVKAASGRANESLVADLTRHLATWPQLAADQPVGGGALIVNHQHKLPPAQRTPQIYSRPEFVHALIFPVISSRDLFDWWRVSDWDAVQSAVLNS